ncbi:MAG: hypothetical protein D6689_12520 [Deltaproteobacteria bacterium]|nr:MAG: hypothetical protein D6689_12520 [Deltaproteobacteria bacterium]
MTIFALALSVFSGGCGELGQVDSPPGGGDPGDQLPDGVACQAELSITGTLTPPGTPPDPAEGCVPVGTWTLQVAVDDPGTCDQVDHESTYVYEVTGDIDNGYDVTYQGTPAGEVYLKITSEGGACQGSFEHYSADGSALLLLKPFEENLAISGRGYFERYAE